MEDAIQADEHAPAAARDVVNIYAEFLS